MRKDANKNLEFLFAFICVIRGLVLSSCCYCVAGQAPENHPVSRSGCHPSFDFGFWILDFGLSSAHREREPPRQPRRLPPLLRKEGSQNHHPVRPTTPPTKRRHPSSNQEGSQSDFGFWILDFGLSRSL